MPRPRRDVLRVTATVPRETVESWRELAELSGQSLSSLIAEFMTELEPGMRQLTALRRRYERLAEDQREALRDALAQASQRALHGSGDSWEHFQATLLDLEAAQDD